MSLPEGILRVVRQMDDDMAQQLAGRFEQAKHARLPWDKATKLNLAYLAGIQWVDERSQPDVFVDVRDLPAPSWRVRLVDNRVLGVYQGLMGRFLAQQMRPYVEPVGADPRNVLSARAATRILRHIYSMEGDDGALGIEHQLGEMYGWLLGTGKVYLYGYWDPNAYVETPSGPEQAGDVRTAVLSPLEVYPDPNVKHFRDAHWVFRTVIRNIDEVKLMYPAAKALKPESLRPEIPLPTGSASAQRSGLWSRPGTIRDSVMLREYFEKPSQKFPEGRYAIYAGTDKPVILRYEEKLPYGKGRLPIRELGFIRIPGANNAMGIVDQLRDLQKYLNEIESRRIEHIRMMAAGKWIVDRTANVDKNAFTSEPGEVIFKDVSGEVSHIPMAPLPPDVEAAMQEIQQSIQQVAQLRDFGMSAPGGGRRTAVEAMIQREIEDLSRAPFFAEVRSVLTRFLTDCLEMARDRYIEPRLIKYGSGLKAEIDALEGVDLEGSWQVKVDINLQGPMAKSERMQIGMELLNLGIFGKAGEQQTVQRFLEFTQLGNMIASPPEETDAEISEQENQGMAHGERYAVGTLDNHSVHLEHHLPAYKKASMDPSTVPYVLQSYEGHIQTHMLHMQREQAAAQQQAAAAQPPVSHPGTHPHGPQHPAPAAGPTPGPEPPAGE